MQADSTLLHRYAEEKSEAVFFEFMHCHVDLVCSAALRRMGGDWDTATAKAQTRLSLDQLAALQPWRRQFEPQKRFGEVTDPMMGPAPPRSMNDLIRAAEPLPKVPGS